MKKYLKYSCSFVCRSFFLFVGLSFNSQSIYLPKSLACLLYLYPSYLSFLLFYCLSTFLSIFHVHCSVLLSTLPSFYLLSIYLLPFCKSMIYLSIYLSSSLSFGLSICHLLFLSIYYLSLTFILPSANVYLSISIYLPIDVS